MEEETDEKIEQVESDIIQLQLENRDLEKRIKKLEEKNNG